MTKAAIKSEIKDINISMQIQSKLLQDARRPDDVKILKKIDELLDRKNELENLLK